MKCILKWMKSMYIGLQEPKEEVDIPFETHSEVNEGMSVFWLLATNTKPVDISTFDTQLIILAIQNNRMSWFASSPLNIIVMWIYIIALPWLEIYNFFCTDSSNTQTRYAQTKM